MSSYPQRIVCLSAEASEILEALDAADLVVGVSAWAKKSDALAHATQIGGFSTPNLEKVTALQPDLVITASDIQADFARDLIRVGTPVLALNPHRLYDLFRTIRLVGGVVGLEARANTLVASLHGELDALRDDRPAAQRPRVYFEEWYSPMISGIGWVGDMIELVGGEEIFPELTSQGLAKDRVIQPEEVIARRPDVIVASWCGKPANLDSIRERAGWQSIPAVQNDRVHEIPSAQILQVGPSILEGARALREIVAQA